MSSVMMIVNDTNFVWNLRREVLDGLLKAGHEVTLVTEVLNFREQIESMGCHIVNVSNGRQGTNPLDDAILFFTYLRVLRKHRPDVVLTNNIKPNVYAGLACQMLKIPYMPNVCGLGTPVETPGMMQKLTSMLYKIGVANAGTIFFQNEENKRFFEDHHMMPRRAKVIVTPGSGVNLERHPVLAWPNDDTVHFLYAARIMKQKGIDLFLAAARKYASEHVIFDVCGQCDDEHYLEILKNEKSIRYHGLQKDMKPFYEQCSCFLYPSYYAEGMSNVLLEAAASGRPVVAADRAGCRETLDDGITGFVVPVNDEEAVVKAAGRIIHMTTDERREMGLKGREKMETTFDRRFVVECFVNEVQRLTQSKQQQANVSA